MPTSRKCLLLLVFLSFALVLAPHAGAIPADYQQCVLNQSCTIGEFLYDDNYVPITDADCTVTSLNPSGDSFIDDDLTPNSDGWYSYSVNTTGATLGLYRTQVCCTAGTDYLCIDKTFTITDNDLTASDVEDAVWDADLSQHQTSGSTGEKLSDTSTLTGDQVEDSVLDAQLTDHQTAGSVGEKISDTSTLDAATIWSYSNRSLTSFGSLVSDIWNYTTRSLTTFGTLVSDIWNNDERTLTQDMTVDTSNLATKTDVSNQTTTLNNSLTTQTNTITGAIDSQTDTLTEAIDDQTDTLTSDNSNQTNTLKDAINAQTTSLTTVINTQTTTLETNLGGANTEELQAIKDQIAHNKTLLEQLLNDPIITDGSATFNADELEAKLEQAADYLSQVYANLQQIVSQLGLILLNWDTLTASEIADELEDILKLIGNNPASNSYSTSILHHLEWLNQTWSNPTTQNTYDATHQALTYLNQTLSQVDIKNKDVNVKTLLESALTELNLTETYLGNLSSTSTSTLFGLLAHYQELSTTLNSVNQQLSNLLSNWSSYNQEDLNDQVSSLKTQILDLNLIPKAEELLTTSGADPNEQLRNTAIALKALINLNQKLLVNEGGQPLQTIWLETNADRVLFRSAVFNPSASDSHAYSLKYYLPKELSLDDVLELQGDLNKTYDTEAEKVYLDGSFNLSPRQILFQVAQTRDFWQISAAELDGIKSQAADLLSTLEDTNYFSRGTQLKGDIDVKLALIKERQANSLVPEDKIMAFRQSLLDLETVRDNLVQLNDLVTQANSSSTLMGFVGGVQAVAVWGIVIIIVAGVVGITLYMRYLHREELAVHGVPVNRQPMRPALPLYQGRLKSVVGRPTPKPRKPLKPKRKTGTDPHQKVFNIAVISLTSATLSAMAAGSLVSAQSNQDTQANQAQNDTTIPSPAGDTSPNTLTANPTPSPQSSVISHQPLNNNITILGSQDDQESISLPPNQGELPNNNPAEGVETGTTQQTNSITQLTLTIPPSERYNLRAHPNPQAQVLTKLSGTIEYQIIENTGEWVNIKLPKLELQGWLHHDLLP